MKFTGAIYNINTLYKCGKYLNSAILMCPKYAYIYEDDFPLDEAISYCLFNRIEVILSIQRIFLENELEQIKQFIIKYKNYHFLVSDLGIVQIFIDLGILDHVIYHPDTLICNSLDLSIYNQYHFLSLGLSNEITIQDVKDIYKNTNASIFYLIFGRKMMFYSKRKLLSLYKNYRKLEFDNKDLTLVEEKRSYHIPIYENDNGIYCYRHYYISLLKDIKQLSFLDYGYFESLSLSDDQYLMILKIFNDYLNNDVSLEQSIALLNELNLPIEDGFSYQDTVYIKEKIVQ